MPTICCQEKKPLPNDKSKLYKSKHWGFCYKKRHHSLIHLNKDRKKKQNESFLSQQCLPFKGKEWTANACNRITFYCGNQYFKFVGFQCITVLHITPKWGLPPWTVTHTYSTEYPGFTNLFQGNLKAHTFKWTDAHSKLKGCHKIYYENTETSVDKPNMFELRYHAQLWEVERSKWRDIGIALVKEAKAAADSNDSRIVYRITKELKRQDFKEDQPPWARQLRISQLSVYLLMWIRKGDIVGHVMQWNPLS